MEIQDAKQARPHCELIAELLDSRQPKTEREHAAVREIERLRHDIERHIAIASEYATECERLRAELAEAKRDAERYHWIKQCALFGITKRQDIVLTLPIYAANHIDELDAAIDAALAAKEE